MTLPPDLKNLQKVIIEMFTKKFQILIIEKIINQFFI